MKTTSGRKLRTIRWTVIIVALFVCGSHANGQAVKELVLPGEAFLVDQRPAFILWPAESRRSNPQPWVM